MEAAGTKRNLASGRASMRARLPQAGYARTIRGGRSGPSAANASTVGTTVVNTVGSESAAGTTGTVARMAPSEQHEAQTLHV